MRPETTRRNSPKHVALVGCGFAGTSAFFQLVDGYRVEEITIFEASGRFGPGYAYQATDSRAYLLNNATDTMCLTPANRRAFVDWLAGHPAFAPELDERGYLPRSLYGAFLEDVFASTRTTAAVKGVRVNLVSEEVTSLYEDGVGRVHLGWDGGEATADIAILTTGRSPDLEGTHPPPGPGACFVPTHIGPDAIAALDSVPPDATVHILGASLSAYDIINHLFSPESGCRFDLDSEGRCEFVAGGNKIHVVLCSRTGRLKKVQSRTPMTLHRRFFTLDALRELAQGGSLTLEVVAELIRHEAEAHDATVPWGDLMEPYGDSDDAAAVNARAARLLDLDIQAAKGGGRENFLVDLFEDAQQVLWDAYAEQMLSPADERLYRSKFETALLCYAAPCPIPTAQRMLALFRAGRLRLVTGAGEISLDESGGGYRLAHRFGVESVRFLIDATGRVDRHVGSDQQPALIKSLVSGGLLAPYERGGGAPMGAAVDMSTFLATGARSVYIANQLLWGPGFFTSSALTMAVVVQRILEGVFGHEKTPSSPPYSDLSAVIGLTPAALRDGM